MTLKWALLPIDLVHQSWVEMNYFLVLSFGQVTSDGLMDGWKAMHMSPPCICTGVLKNRGPGSSMAFLGKGKINYSQLDFLYLLKETLVYISQTILLILFKLPLPTYNTKGTSSLLSPSPQRQARFRSVTEFNLLCHWLEYLIRGFVWVLQFYTWLKVSQTVMGNYWPSSPRIGWDLLYCVLKQWWARF